MGRTAKFLLVLVAGLAALTGVGYALLTGMMRSWSEDDLALRSRLAVAAANDSFDGQWPDGRPPPAASAAPGRPRTSCASCR